MLFSMLIGITSYLQKLGNFDICGIKVDYIEALLHVAREVGIAITPVVIPSNCTTETIRFYAQNIDALVITGNTYDISPKFYNSYVKYQNVKICDTLGEQRTVFELELYKHFVETKKPLLGICAGLQIMNISHGGTLFQDIKTDIETNISHKSTYHNIAHSININSGTKLYDIVKESIIDTNSVHHQSIDKLGKDLVISAYTDDKVIEAIELKIHPFAIGLQWHPEYLLSKHEFAIFREFISIASKVYNGNKDNNVE